MRFETRYTYDFIKRFVPSECRRILEVGCGTGGLAARLSNDGYSVVAVDCDSDSVAAARRLHVDARIATWPNFGDGQFDAILFTRSLHHIHPLAESIKHAAGSLVAGGLIIVEISHMNPRMKKRCIGLPVRCVFSKRRVCCPRMSL
jgi:SAM-dependent methyltransferase